MTTIPFVSPPAVEHTRLTVVQRPTELGAFEFVVLSTLRAAQLMRGCIPLIERGVHKATVIAQFEVASGKIRNVPMDMRPLVVTGIPAIAAIATSVVPPALPV